MKKRKADFILIAVLLVVGVLSVVLFNLFGKAGGTVIVTENGEKIAEYSLSENREIVIKSKNGENTLSIKNGEAEISSASCPDKICQNHRPIKREGESIICIPNKIVVSVEK